MKPGAIQVLGRDMQMLEPFSMLKPSAFGVLALVMCAITDPSISLGQLG